MRIIIHGTLDQVTKVTPGPLVVQVASVSEPYANRKGTSRLHRVYLDADLTAPPTPGDPPPAGDLLIGQMVTAADALTDAAGHLHTAAAALHAAGADTAARRRIVEGLAVQTQAEADALADVIAAWEAGEHR